MMQFTESAAPAPPHYSSGFPGLCLDLAAAGGANGGAVRSRPWPDLPSSVKSLGSYNAACMEQLLVHCANAIESNDATLAQQILWVLNNIAPPDGDSNQRLTAAFLRALIVRASRSGSASCAALASAMASVAAAPSHPSVAAADPSLRLSAVSLAGFIDLTPWHRFGFSAANAAIAEAVEGFQVIHIVDLSTTHSMQLPTLIDSLAGRPDGPPFIRLTVPCFDGNSPPPLLDMPLDELGSKLVNFARSRNVGMEFRAVPSSPTDGLQSMIEQLRVQQLINGHETEALIINCHMMLHRIPDESAGASIPSPRTAFLKSLRSLDPTLVVVVDEDADFTAGDVVGRLRAAFNYMWIPFDAVETFLPVGSEQRRRYEAAVGWKIENVIAQEGVGRVERLETRGRWVQRMRGAGFHGGGFGEEAAAEVKGMLDEHSAGWGMKRDEDDLVLTWKGHDVVFASAWLPSF
ncbi:Scarecrow-like protein 32 [Apostasia shenzhenica]|uniref:Scarecrow-like protein 32 n=1 Tax=Apostasia shenzhenica TaxID=1088818 RepID=A0A2I0ADM6_9ASPA|nr:Scarecrow-like protein 32 [Apostasia shenzhenica]